MSEFLRISKHEDDRLIDRLRAFCLGLGYVALGRGAVRLPGDPARSGQQREQRHARRKRRGAVSPDEPAELIAKRALARLDRLEIKVPADIGRHLGYALVARRRIVPHRLHHDRVEIALEPVRGEKRLGKPACSPGWRLGLVEDHAHDLGGTRRAVAFPRAPARPAVRTESAQCIDVRRDRNRLSAKLFWGAIIGGQHCLGQRLFGRHVADQFSDPEIQKRGRPSASTRIFPGLRSRWTISRACA